jgi:hypothetical protein
VKRLLLGLLLLASPVLAGSPFGTKQDYLLGKMFNGHGNFAFLNSTNDPFTCSTIDKGAVYFNTTSNVTKTCNGTAWVFVPASGSALTSGRVVFSTTGGALTDDSDMTFSVDTLTVTKIAATQFTGAVNFGAFTPYFTYTSVGNSSTAVTVNWTTGGCIQTVTITGAATFTFTAPPGPSSLVLVLVHEASATSYALTWPGAVKWPGGTKVANTNTSGAIDVVTCVYNGTNYLCTGSTNFS